jgi:hypothetical protein
MIELPFHFFGVREISFDLLLPIVPLLITSQTEALGLAHKAHSAVLPKIPQVFHEFVRILFVLNRCNMEGARTPVIWHSTMFHEITQ